MASSAAAGSQPPANKNNELSELSDVGTPPLTATKTPPPPKKRPAPVPSASSAAPLKKSKQASSSTSSGTLNSTNGQSLQQRTLASLFAQSEPKPASVKAHSKAPSNVKPMPSSADASAKPLPNENSNEAQAAARIQEKKKVTEGSDEAAKAKAAPANDRPLCHQHRHHCASSLLQCTFIRNGSRCPLRYCHYSLKNVYEQDPASIEKSGRLMIDETQHCPPQEAKYAWKCPRCRNRCACSACRKKLTPSHPGGVTELGWNEANKPAKDSAVAAQAAKQAPKDKEKDKGKAKSSAEEIMTPPPSSPKASATELPAAVRPKPPQPRVLKAPVPVPAPSLEIIETRLPHENLRARMWLYESFVRFDKIGLPRSELNHLDRFESWSHTRVREMFSTLLRFLAGLQSIEKGQPTRHTTKAVTAFRKYGHDLSRGEPWTASREMLARFGLDVPELPYVEHPLSLELENRATSPPAPRETRNRAAKNHKPVNYASQLGMLKDWEEEFGEGDDNEREAKVAVSSRKGAKRGAKRLASDSDDDDLTEAETEGDSRAPSPELGRRNSRRQANAQQQTKPNGSSSKSRRSSVEAEPETVDDAPDMETKIALLSSMIDAALMTDELAEELKLAPDEIVALERQYRADVAVAEKEMAEQTAELNKRAPSLIAPEFQAWKAEKAELEKENKWRRLDMKVCHDIQVNAHALRTGPIGYDLDGREYWHLREYQDRMPRFTEGRYSWCLIVLGPPFPAAPAKPAETDPASAVDMGAKPDETAVTKVTHASSDANATTGFSKPASLTIEKEPTPSSKRQGKPSKEIFIDIPFSSSYKKALHNPSSPSPSTTKAKAETGRATAKANDGSVCMGTNDPVVIASLIAYVRYRCDQINYLEDKELLHRQHAADGATEEVEVREEQARRKDQVMRLCKRLHAAREYFAWHREEVIL